MVEWASECSGSLVTLLGGWHSLGLRVTQN